MNSKVKSMEVSPFELLVKPIAPRTPNASLLNKVARRVIQGYFLTISNLMKDPLKLKVSFTISAPDVGFIPPETRILLGNAVLLYDVAGDNQILNYSEVASSPNEFIVYDSESFLLPPLATGSLQLLPDVGKFILNPDPEIEIRGFASLFSSERAEVLLNPEIRGTFLPNDFPLVCENLDFDNLSYSLGSRREVVAEG